MVPSRRWLPPMEVAPTKKCTWVLNYSDKFLFVSSGRRDADFS